MNETEEDFLAAALARAQMDARARGFTRSPVPTFVMQGVKGPTPGALVGANESPRGVGKDTGHGCHASLVSSVWAY